MIRDSSQAERERKGLYGPEGEMTAREKDDESARMVVFSFLYLVRSSEHISSGGMLDPVFLQNHLLNASEEGLQSLRAGLEWAAGHPDYNFASMHPIPDISLSNQLLYEHLVKLRDLFNKVFPASLFGPHAPRFQRGLMRSRDALAFLEVARRIKGMIVLRVADRNTGKYVGKEGYAPFPYPWLAVPRPTPPNEGLMTVDNAVVDVRVLSCFPEGYAAYLHELARLGFTHGDKDDGFLVRDQLGRAMYPSYHLHGVYDADSGVNLWNARNGERIRRILNARLGADLVLAGPHDVWEGRRKRDQMSALKGPLFPVLCFLPDGTIKPCSLDLDLKDVYEQLGVDWDALFGPAEAEEEEP